MKDIWDCKINRIQLKELTILENPSFSVTAEFQLLHVGDEGTIPLGAAKINGFPTQAVMDKAREFVAEIEKAVAAIYDAKTQEDKTTTVRPHRGLPEI